jgi:tetratricopeptide (TPR) repeat protein
MVPGGRLSSITVSLVTGAAPGYCRVRWQGRQGWVKREEVVTPAEGLVYFEGRADRDPSDGYAHCLYAFALMQAGQCAAARREADEAARLLPADSRPLQVRIGLACPQGAWQSALDDLSVAVRIDPSNSDLYVMRAAVVGMGQRQYEKALADIDTALRLAPGHEAAYTVRAQIWRLKGEYHKAAADLDVAVRAAPDAVFAHAQRAELLSRCPEPAVVNLKEAVTSARRACELTRGEDPEHLLRLAAVCWLAGETDEAMRCQEKAMQIGSGNAAQVPH